MTKQSVLVLTFACACACAKEPAVAQAPMDEDASARTAPAPSSPSSSSSSPSSEDDAGDGITVVTPTERIVSRDAVRRVLSGKTTSDIRLVPEMGDGAVNGIRVFGIRPDGIGARLGLANGDVLEAVNGQSLGDASKVLEIFETLKNDGTREVTVDLRRRGAPVRLHYTIQ